MRLAVYHVSGFQPVKLIKVNITFKYVHSRVVTQKAYSVLQQNVICESSFAPGLFWGYSRVERQIWRRSYRLNILSVCFANFIPKNYYVKNMPYLFRLSNWNVGSDKIKILEDSLLFRGHLRPVLCGILSIIVHTNYFKLLQFFLFQYSGSTCINLPMHLFLLFYVFENLCRITNCLKKLNPSWWVDSSSASQNGSFFFNLKVHYHCYNKLPFVLILE